MKKLTVVLGYRRLSTVNKPEYAMFIINAMSGNAFFPEPVVLLENVRKKAIQLENRYIASRDSTKKATQQMYQSDFELGVMLDFLAAYVQNIANNDMEKGMEIIYSAGLQVKDSKGARIRKFTVENTVLPGKVKLITASAGIRTAYNWEYSTDQLNWKYSHGSTLTNTHIEGLQAGTRYYFRVSVTKRQQTGAYSEVITIIVT